jgi:adenylosuccinate lyase
VLDAWAGIAQSASKFGTDLRLLQHEGELFEPAEADQVGSSAMPYKRNPMRAERLCALSRYLIALRENTAYTAATQWLERSLDDSANRRLVLPDAALAADAILVLAADVARGLEVREGTIGRNVERAMPFMATERWLMLAVRAGGDRQTVHELMRRHSWDVVAALERGGPNDLLDRLAAEPPFAGVDAAALRAQLDPIRYVGRAPAQVTEYLREHVGPLLTRLAPYAPTDQPGVRV